MGPRRQRLTLLPGRAQSHSMTLARPVDASARDENGAELRSHACWRSGGRRSWACSTSRRTPFRTVVAFSIPSIADRAGRNGWLPAGADILDIGAESTRPYGGAVPVPIEEEIRRLAPVLPSAVALGVPVSIDTMKAKVAAWALASGAAIVNDVWGLQRDGDLARVVAEHGVPVIIMHNREAADPSIDIMADIAAFFSRSLEIAARAGIARGEHRARPRHRLRQDCGAERHGHRPACRAQILWICRCSSALRANASSIRFRPPRPTNAWADRSPPMFLRPQTAPRSSARMTSPRPCRRCASPPPFGARDDRRRIRHRAFPPCLSWRDAARGQGRTDFQSRSRPRHRPDRTLRAPTSSRTPWVTIRSSRSPARRSAPAAIGWSRPRPARSRPPCSIGSRGSRGCGSRSTNPTRRSRRPLPMSGSPSCALANVADLTSLPAALPQVRCEERARPVRARAAKGYGRRDRDIGIMAEALVAFGGNVGNVRATLDRAVAAFCDERCASSRPLRGLSARRPGGSRTSRLSSISASRSKPASRRMRS